MSVDYTALRPGTLIHGGGFGLLVEAITPYKARVMSLCAEDIGQIREWGNSADVISEPKSDVDAAVLMRSYNVAGLTEPHSVVIVKNTEAAWIEYRLAVKVPDRVLRDPEETAAAAREAIDRADFEVLSGPDVRASVDGFDQEYEVEGPSS